MKKNRMLIPVFMVIAYWGCTKMDSTYKEFLADGPIIYSQKVDSVKVYPGRNRVLITWKPIRDPRVSKINISWGGSSESKEIPVTSVRDTSLLLEGLAEGNYIFNFYTSDELGNRSVKTEALGTTYDTLYERGLTLRDITSLSRTGTTLSLSFKSMTGVEAYSGQEVTYRSSADGQNRKVIFNPNQSEVSISDFSGNSLTHRSVYKPQILSPDSFYSVSRTVSVP